MDRRGWCVVACLVLASGCMGEDGTDIQADPTEGTSGTTTAPAAPEGGENATEAPTYALLWAANLTVQVGHPAACSIGPPGYLADAFTGGSTFEEVDYDTTPIDPAWAGAAANFTGQSDGDMVLVWLDETGGPVEAHIVSPDEALATEVPEGTHAAGFATCGHAGGTGLLIVRESEAMFTRRG